MKNSMESLKRREALTLAGIGALALTGLTASPHEAKAADQTPGEQANIKVVKDFLDYFQTKAPDPAKMADYFTEDGAYHLHLPNGPRPVVSGKAAVTDQFKQFVTGRSYNFKILEIYAKGPLVVTSRMDAISTPDKPGTPAPNLGVFLLSGGKIQQWDSIAYKPA